MISIVLLTRTNLFTKEIRCGMFLRYLPLNWGCVLGFKFDCLYWCESVWGFNKYGTYGNGCNFDGTYLLNVDMCWVLYLVECTVPCFQCCWWIELFLLIMQRFVITYWKLMLWEICSVGWKEYDVSDTSVLCFFYKEKLFLFILLACFCIQSSCGASASAGTCLSEWLLVLPLHSVWYVCRGHGFRFM